jgi:DNA polymerase V
MKQHTYIAIDLKSFNASVECRERGLDPLDTNLVVADESRRIRLSALLLHPPSKATASLGGDGYSRSSSV